MSAVQVRPVIVRDEPDAHQVWLVVGVQSFTVGGHMPTKAEADWYADQLRHALAANDGTRAAPACSPPSL